MLEAETGTFVVLSAARQCALLSRVVPHPRGIVTGRSFFLLDGLVGYPILMCMLLVASVE